VAATTSPWAVDGHWFTDFEPVNTRPKGCDPPGILVAQGERKIVGQESTFKIVEEMQIRMASTGTPDPDHHLSRSRVRLRHLSDLRIMSPISHLKCPH
jgi:hypothetical protein